MADIRARTLDLPGRGERERRRGELEGGRGVGNKFSHGRESAEGF